MATTAVLDDHPSAALLATGETVRKRTVETVSELTAQEAHIARLAVDGRTNAEIGAQRMIFEHKAKSTRTVTLVAQAAGKQRCLCPVGDP